MKKKQSFQFNIKTILIQLTLSNIMSVSLQDNVQKTDVKNIQNIK